METKEQALQYIKMLAEQKIITKDELDLAYASASAIQPEIVSTKRRDVAEILYYIGGTIVFLGIAILLEENWSILKFEIKVLATLGAGLAAYFVGILLCCNQRTEAVGSAFYLISALVIPMGLYVVLDKIGLDVYMYRFQSDALIPFENIGFGADSYRSQSLISLILLSMYALSYAIFRRSIFILFSILFATWLFFSLSSAMMESHVYFDGWKFYAYRVFVVGIIYMLLGYVFSKNKHASLANFFYDCGIFGCLGSALILGGRQPEQNIFWQLAYPGLVFAALFFSVHIKRKLFLIWVALFLMSYIIKTTWEYFSNSLGWSFALVISGLMIIGVSYLFLTLNKKYLAV